MQRPAASPARDVYKRQVEDFPLTMNTTLAFFTQTEKRLGLTAAEDGTPSDRWSKMCIRDRVPADEEPCEEAPHRRPLAPGIARAGDALEAGDELIVPASAGAGGRVVLRLGAEMCIRDRPTSA